MKTNPQNLWPTVSAEVSRIVQRQLEAGTLHVAKNYPELMTLILGSLPQKMQCHVKLVSESSPKQGTLWKQEVLQSFANNVVCWKTDKESSHAVGLY